MPTLNGSIKFMFISSEFSVMWVFQGLSSPMSWWYNINRHQSQSFCCVIISYNAFYMRIVFEKMGWFNSNIYWGLGNQRHEIYETSEFLKARPLITCFCFEMSVLFCDFFFQLKSRIDVMLAFSVHLYNPILFINKHSHIELNIGTDHKSDQIRKTYADSLILTF